MTDIETTPPLFKERSPDTYVLAAGQNIAQEVAWSILRTFEFRRTGGNEHYDDKHKKDVIDSLLGGIEERPYGGIFSVELVESFEDDEQLNLLVSNRNGQNDKQYTGILREVVGVVGINESEQS